MEVTTGIDENGESYNEVRLHTENLTPPVMQRGGRMIFIVNNESIDITGELSPTKAFRYDYTETTPENLYEQDNDRILQDLKRLFTYRGLDGCRMRNGFHFEYKGLHMTYHKTLPYSTIVEEGPDGVTYDILYDILIKQNGDIHSDWTGVQMDVDAYRKVVFEPYDLRVLEGTVDF